MTFGREVDNNVDMVPGEYIADSFEIADIPLFKEIRTFTELFIDVGKIHQIPCVGKLVKINDRTIEVSLFQYESDEIRSDEAGTTRDKDVRRCRVQRIRIIMMFTHGLCCPFRET